MVANDNGLQSQWASTSAGMPLYSCLTIQEKMVNYLATQGSTSPLTSSLLSQPSVMDIEALIENVQQEMDAAESRARAGSSSRKSLRLERRSFSTGESNDNKLACHTLRKQPVLPKSESPTLSLVTSKNSQHQT
ncbi:hypothetical protein PVK06_040149 [Gossypium arboreum]|uniref:Uncharacterized protein n=1 Tax=Gossypium arboreum TaxID=29729 RepID=A0ABR0N4P3_GOSAR|nr:hypothetical protein PVK06_040149 [Gossypium arboreum]